MVLKHIALVCSSEENSDKFYETLLGLEKKNTRMVPSQLSKQIFNLDSEYKIVNYADDKIHFEIFIDHQKRFDNQRIEHVCLELGDVEDFLSRCRTMEVEIRQIPREDGSFLTFVTDYDCNLFEIKQN
ncbi:VOC family protein [Desulfonema magnum]|uniref:VOC domain-containing protein n=1 Tax=Desulfonema magnum TaxID=45655 RepID=A0A975BJ20_9BACT|nr:VOC family protein [Desulfonema magnum]QTA86467.1 VOC domain-containing protein [Desulfonema magnum]